MNRLVFGYMKKTLLCVSLILLPFVCAMNTFGQAENSDLLDQKITIHISKGTFIYALATLSQKYGLPIGLEKSAQHADRQNINLDVAEKSLREVLDSIVQQEPEYKWELTNNVLNFTPSRNRHEFSSAFLAININQIVYSPEDDADALKDAMLALPEVIRLMKSKKVKYAEYLNEPSFEPLFSKKPDNFATSNISIKDFLNQLIRDSQHKTWVLEMVGENKNKFLLSF